MATVTVSELNQQTARVLERVKNGEPITITEYGRAIARLVPNSPSTGDPILDALIAQGQVIAAANPAQIPPTPPREELDGDIILSDQLLRDREEERY
ncbi:MAG: type II toxin-antitoxin system Phd/YefM family antitoxin [Actinocrinis sp.]